MKNKKIGLIIFIGIILIGLFSACNSDGAKTRKTIEFDDGSKIITQGGPIYFHRLFDNYILCSGDGFFTQELRKRDTDLPFIETSLPVKRGYYLKYSFDPSGYIAYYRITEADIEQTSGAYRKRIGDESRTVVSEEIVLYCCGENKEIIFENTDSLYEYCDKNGINLGVVYYSHGYGSVPEEDIVKVNRWSITKAPWDCYYNIKNGRSAVFVGSVDAYCVADKYLIAHLELLDNFDSLKDTNLSINYDKDSTVGHKWAGLFERYGIYSDNYVVIDTSDNTYKIFDTKNDAENFVKTSEKSLDWVKI